MAWIRSAIDANLGRASARRWRAEARPTWGQTKIIALLLVMLALTRPAHAEETSPDNPGDLRPQMDPDETHPMYASSSDWVASFLIGSAGLFLAAMVIGPIVRAEAPDAVPPAMSHEEDPAVDRH